jgi:hypothetical protein
VIGRKEQTCSSTRTSTAGDNKASYGRRGHSGDRGPLHVEHRAQVALRYSTTGRTPKVDRRGKNELSLQVHSPNATEGPSMETCRRNTETRGRERREERQKPGKPVPGRPGRPCSPAGVFDLSVAGAKPCSSASTAGGSKPPTGGVMGVDCGDKGCARDGRIGSVENELAVAAPSAKGRSEELGCCWIHCKCGSLVCSLLHAAGNGSPSEKTSEHDESIPVSMLAPLLY